MSVKKYGKIKEEERVESAIKAREIAKAVIDYGISQYQLKRIIYLLSQELEDIHTGSKICKILTQEETEEIVDENGSGIILT